MLALHLYILYITYYIGLFQCQKIMKALFLLADLEDMVWMKFYEFNKNTYDSDLFDSYFCAYLLAVPV